MPGKLTKETRKHLDAFEIYYAMGERRTLARLAQALGLNPRTVEVWSKTLRWRERVADRDALLSGALKDELGCVLTQTKVQAVAVLRKTIEGTAKLGKDGVTVVGSRISAVDVNDFEKLVKTYQLMTGGATERPDVTVGGVLRVPTAVSAEEWEKGAGA